MRLQKGAPFPYLKTMSQKSFPTKWPYDFDPDNPLIMTLAAVIDEGLQGNEVAKTTLHQHPTGQLVLATGGLVGLELEDGYWSIPAQCAVWVPPFVPHQGVLGLTGRSVFFHIGSNWLDGLPTTVERLMLNPMTVEMIMFMAHGSDRRRSEAQRRNLSLAIIEELKVARHLPPHFAPLPKSHILQRIAMELADLDKRAWPMAGWAKFVGVSERTLARLSQTETGLSFNQWRLQHIFLTSVSHLATEQSIEEIAYLSGYQNTSAFIKAFKSVFGVTPGEYRRQMQVD